MTEPMTDERRAELLNVAGWIRNYETKKIIHELLDELDRRDADDGWISVEDRLPEPGVRVFAGCRVDGRWADQATLRHRKRDALEVFWGLATYWRPIPEPPKDTT